MKLGFIFTNYFSCEHSEKVIKSLSQLETFQQHLIIIVDNNSDEKNKQILTQLALDYSNVKIIFNNDNIGYFKGLNIGINFLKENYQDIEVLIIGNNDLIFPKNFYEQLSNKRHLLDTIPVISPNIITADGEHQNPHVIAKISFFREVMYDLYYSNFFIAKLIKQIAHVTKRFTGRSDEEQFDKAQFIYQGHGSCYILGPTFFEHFKELFSPTFLMSEEFFLSYQLSTKNFQTFYEPSIEIQHSWHSSINNLPKKKMWQIARDAHRVYRKYVNPYTYQK